MTGCTNLLRGRRSEFDKCKYWVRSESDKTLEEYKHNVKPSGIFYAKEITPENLQKLIINNVFMFDEHLITLYTKADLNANKGDLVEYNGDMWIINTCQKQIIHKHSQFMKSNITASYIQLKK